MRDLERQLQTYVSQFAKVMESNAKGRDLRYQSFFDLLIKEGRLFNPDPYTKSEEQFILGALQDLRNSPRSNICFYNAQTLANEERLPYAEGYVLAKELPVPIEHGWNTLASGKVVDLTLRAKNEKNTCNPKKLLDRAKRNQVNAYMGISFPPEEIQKSWVRNGLSLMLLEDPVILSKIFDQGYPSSWRSPSMGATSREEEWLNLPERENETYRGDPTRSPFEGDIPPWAQRGYAGIFPLKGKVFYITAYVGHGRERIIRQPRRVPSPVLGAAFPIQDVGTAPRGVQFGSEFVYHRFAAIPVRNEDRNEAGPVIDYLIALIQELGVFGKILLEEEFPAGDSVRVPGGRWFPVAENPIEYGGIKFLNAYTVNSIYGGPEEGGWWFDEGYPVASVPLREEDPAARIEWEYYLRNKAGWTSPHEKSSVLGHDVFEIGLEDNFARHYPEETPRYG